MLSEGVFVKQLYVDDEKRTVTSLYKMEPGAQAPRHIHSGAEECFVIEGDFHINDLKLGPGDYHRAEPGSLHQKIYTEKGNLLLIIAPQD
jgi:anti-sigma factor ChrR (cupin superfamily)